MKTKSLIAALAFFGAVAGGAHASNLVANGDFSQGNTGFTSGYQYVAPTSGALYPEGLYTVASNPIDVHPYWVSLTDGTTREIVNGATASTPVVWEEDGLSTIAGQNYSFSAQAANICCNASFSGENDPSTLLFQLSENGGKTFTTESTILTHPPGDAGQFQTADFNFVATGSTDVRITDALTGQSGNDFAIQNISVSAAPEPSTWLLMFAGIGGIGLMLRQAKKTMGFRFKDALAV